MKKAKQIVIWGLTVLAAALILWDIGISLGITKTTQTVQQMAQQPLPEAEPQDLQPETSEPEKTQPPAEAEHEDEPENEPDEPEKPAQELQEILDTFCGQTTGKWDVLVYDLGSDAVLGRVQAEEPMVSASLIKLFIMAAVYEQVELGSLNYESVAQPIRYMITVSDNYSANQLVKLLGGGDAAAGMAAVNAYAASIGCEASVQNRLMLEDNGLQNYTSAADCACLLKMIYEGTCVNEKWSAEMLQILKAQEVTNRIPAGLPQGIACANKTGDLAGLCCGDVGIVFAEAGDYILCVICNDYTVEPSAAIAALSGRVYQYLNKKDV